MPLTVLMDLPRFEEVVVAPAAFHGDARLNASAEGLRMAMVDASHTSMLMLDAKPGAFREYEYLVPEPETSFWVPLDKMAAFDKKARGAGGKADVLVVLSHGEAIVLRSGRVSARTGLLGGDPGALAKFPPIDSETVAARARLRINHADLKKAVEAVLPMAVSGVTKKEILRTVSIRFDVRGTTFTISTGEPGEDQGCVEMDDVEPFLGRDTTDIQTIVSTDLLMDVLDAMPARVLQLYIGDEHPLGIRYADEHLELLGYVAPRIEEGGRKRSAEPVPEADEEPVVEVAKL